LTAATPAALASIAGARTAGLFLQQDLLATDQGLYVVGIVDPRERSWSAVLCLDPQGQLRAVGDAVDRWLWALERDSRGNLWVGGDGVYGLRDGAWAHVWPAR
jgi:hypothetical protein